MPVIHVSTWPVKNEEKVQTMIEEITRSVHENLGAPLDKISVYITEVEPTRWSDAGVLGSNPEFPSKSRRTSYTEKP